MWENFTGTYFQFLVAYTLPIHWIITFIIPESVYVWGGGGKERFSYNKKKKNAFFPLFIAAPSG